MDAWANFLRFHARVTDVLEEELRRDAGMPLTWYDVLIQLHHAPGGRLRMQELAEAVVLSKSGLTRLVDRLERAGLVERRSCPSDRRGTFAELTPAGHKRLEAAMPVHHRGIAEHFSAHLTEEQLDVMEEAFAALLAAHGDFRAPGRSCAPVDTSDASPVP
jgi:DNA-binding MarR family transcriptional regulator